MYRAKIAGVGKYLPKKIMTNRDLEQIVNTNDEWISSRTGIRERRIVAEGETTSMMGAEASKNALAMAGVSPEEVDAVLFATITPDMVFPASACLVQDMLKIPNAATVDLEAACSGFVYAASLAAAYVESGMYKNVLVIGAESMSKIIDWTDRNTCILFGDGAGAALITRSGDDSGIIGFNLRADGSYRDLLYQEAGGSLKPASHDTVDAGAHFLRMNGNATFKVAVRAMSESLLTLFQKHSIDSASIDLVIPHQANIRIVEGVAERLNYPMEKIFVNLNKYGNTSAATIPIALTEALEEGRIKKGDRIGMVALGGGFTWGSMLMRW